MANTYVLISSTVLSSGQNTVTFSSIPSTYTDLVVRCSVRTSNASNLDRLAITINSDSNTNYSDTEITGTGSAASSGRTSNGIYSDDIYINAANYTASTFSSVEIYIPNYTSTSSRPFSVFSTTENNGTTSYIRGSAQLYRGSSAISSLSFFPPSSGSTNFITGSSFYLYGVKNS